MIQTINVNRDNWTKSARKTWKDKWVSSVELSQNGYNTKNLRELCDRSLYRHAIKFNISGSIKYWFSKDTIEEITTEIWSRK